MEIETVNKQVMDGLRKLADVEAQVSHAKAIIEEMKRTESEYIQKREEKTLAAIEKLVSESDDLIKKIQTNSTEVINFYNTVTSNVAFLSEMSNKLSGLFKTYDEYIVAYEKRLDESTQKLSEQRIELRNIEKELEKEREHIEMVSGENKKHEQYLESRESALRHALQVIKDKSI